MTIGTLAITAPENQLKVQKHVLLYKQQWNTRWAFVRKHDIFTRENNMLSSHVKISPFLRLHNKSRLLQQKLKGLVFIGVYIIKRILHGRLEIRNFSSRVKINFTRSLSSLVKYYSTLEEKFRISSRPCNILYLILIVPGPRESGGRGAHQVFPKVQSVTLLFIISIVWLFCMTNT